jgi:hypothetical protein
MTFYLVFEVEDGVVVFKGISTSQTDAHLISKPLKQSVVIKAVPNMDTNVCLTPQNASPRVAAELPLQC